MLNILKYLCPASKDKKNAYTIVVPAGFPCVQMQANYTEDLKLPVLLTTRL